MPKKNVVEEDDGEMNWYKSKGVQKLIEKEDEREDLQKLIVELPEDQKDVLTMRLYKDMSFKEIAETTG